MGILNFLFCIFLIHLEFCRTCNVETLLVKTLNITKSTSMSKLILRRFWKANFKRSFDCSWRIYGRRHYLDYWYIDAAVFDVEDEAALQDVSLLGVSQVFKSTQSVYKTHPEDDDDSTTNHLHVIGDKIQTDAPAREGRRGLYNRGGTFFNWPESLLLVLFCLLG